MNIAIAATPGGRVSRHFGRTPGFLVIDSGAESIAQGQWRENPGSHGVHHHHAHQQGNAGIQIGLNGPGNSRGPGAEHGQGAGHGGGHAGILALLSDCDVVIAAGMGARMYENLHALGKTVLITDIHDTGEALAAYRRGDLRESAYAGCRH